MAKLPRRRAQRLGPGLLGVLLVASALPGAQASDRATLDLAGTWHLLVHYTDDHAHDPEQVRWDDKVWIFEREGSRLRWKEYPIVVFEDETGRFENLGGSHAARVPHGWEPNEGQLAQIRAGLEVNDRGMKSKTLRRSGDAWRSGSRPTAASASVVTYVEFWTIEDASGRPTFRREDVLGAGRADDLEGVTLYVTEEVAAGGDVLRGTFERDGSRHGTFRLMRAGATGQVKGSGKSDGQRFYETYLGGLGAALSDGDGGALRETVRQRAQQGGEVPEEVRAAVRDEVRALLEERVRKSGRDPREVASEVDSLTEQIERQILEEGRTFEEVEQMLQRGEIQP